MIIILFTFSEYFKKEAVKKVQKEDDNIEIDDLGLIEDIDELKAEIALEEVKQEVKVEIELDNKRYPYQLQQMYQERIQSLQFALFELVKYGSVILNILFIKKISGLYRVQ
ncbi:Hypothetical_protein [Hexamita inflata]|uniref:Hypothetical_protein n=1 Tax=Hexamita inflata TaxID=28002 RepID=A0AA86NDW3_9EUKA|nr:Hypothetical protein HINF_LOCUS5003 [Hexamita inflata]